MDKNKCQLIKSRIDELDKLVQDFNVGIEKKEDLEDLLKLRDKINEKINKLYDIFPGLKTLVKELKRYKKLEKALAKDINED